MLPTLTPPIVHDSMFFCVTSWDVPWFIHAVCHEAWNASVENLWKASSVRSSATLAVEILPKHRLPSSLSCSPKWCSSITSQSSHCIYEARFTVHFAFVFLFGRMLLLLLASFAWEEWEFFCNASGFLSYIDISQIYLITIVPLR